MIDAPVSKVLVWIDPVAGALHDHMEELEFEEP
jgi:hypothetical protein